MLLSIVTTLYRSAPHLQEFYDRSRRAAEKLTPEYEIVLVNDGSPDASLELAVALQQKDPHVLVIDLSRNFGHHRAMMTGLSYARGEYVYLLDSDLEEEPEWVLPFYTTLRQESLDVVYGVQQERKGNLFERWSGTLFYKLFNLLSSTAIPKNAAIARLMTRRYVTQLLQHREREVFMPGLWQLTGYRQQPSPVTKHSKGTTSYSLALRISLFVNAITSFSDRPLVYIFYTGATICAVSGLYIARLLYLKWSSGFAIMGWPSLIVSIWFLGGLTILFIGILGVYMAKIYREIKHRPYVLVREVFPPRQPVVPVHD
jgi:putative glycosyltransferase